MGGGRSKMQGQLKMGGEPHKNAEGLSFCKGVAQKFRGKLKMGGGHSKI